MLLRPLAALLMLAGLSVAARADLPTLLACAPDDIHRAALTLDEQGAPLGASVSIAAGTRECDLSTEGAPIQQPDGSWRFTWRDRSEGGDHALRVSRSAAGYAVTLQPAACGALVLPSTFMLAAAGKGCQSSVDRHAAFVQFWRSLREAIARDDGAALEKLSLPQLLFVEGPDDVKAPASVMRHAARCLPDVPAPVQRTDLRAILMATDSPRLDMPPLSNRRNQWVSFAGAMTAAWTPQGWRIEGFNASPSVMRDCKAGR
ncbi:hypothetical protein ACS5PN_13060 [Roseateles sp. NT4]|uniref:hypothetical protein n=1 Tax=Roseateles sp. NT4 TaxID=3453715 RepID=UPI003EF03B5A